nr:low molecular weight protein-tyrosine-phosphatase [Nitrosomonas mobilis]
MVVCVGNICRSPMAEGLLRQAMNDAGKVDRFVGSAGLNALVGHQADPSACQLMASRQIDISAHRACQINSVMIRAADLVLVMESAHKIAIEGKEPSARGKVFRLGEWGKFNIPDPYQQDLAAFEYSLMLIERGVSDWVVRL